MRITRRCDFSSPDTILTRFSSHKKVQILAKRFSIKNAIGGWICKSTVMNVVDGWWICCGQLCFISQEGICQIGSYLTVSDRLWGILRNEILKRTGTELCQMSFLSECMFKISHRIQAHIRGMPSVCTELRQCTFNALFLCPMQFVI